MEKIECNNVFQKPAVLVALALTSCALWGAAFPAVKIGFELFGVETSGDKILFAGYRFFMAGVLQILIFLEALHSVVKEWYFSVVWRLDFLR